MEGSRKSIFFLKTPSLKDLIGVTLSIDVCTISNEDCHNKRILKCREIIFTRKEVLATPLLDCTSMFMIILKLEDLEESDIKRKLDQMKLQIVQTEKVNIFLLKQCLHYTMLAKLAPKWNQVGNLLVQGRDFLTSSQPLNAIRVELIVTEEEMHLALNATCIRLPMMKDEDAGFESLNSQRNECRLTKEFCFVLPSMRKGYISSLTKFIPEYSSIKSYKAMKRYWKNTYGYRLPETDDNIIYYNIKFWNLSEKLFTYPNLCVRPYEALIVPRIDPFPIISSFVNDFHCQMKEILNQSVPFLSTQPTFPCIQFSQADEGNPSRCGSTNLMPVSSRPFRSITSYLSQVNSSNSLEDKPIKSSYFSDNKYFSGIKNPTVNLSQFRKLEPKQTKYFPIFTQRKNKISHKSLKMGPKFVQRTNKTIIPPITLDSFFNSKKSNPVKKNIDYLESNSQSIGLEPFCKTSDKSIFRNKVTSKPPSLIRKSDDVNEMAKCGKLSKVNRNILAAWLKEKGKICKSKESKAELVEKVLNELKTNVTEE